MSPVEKIEHQALKLERDERAELAKVLILSLESSEEAENERVWAEEAKRRHRDWKDGNSEMIPSSEVFADAKARLG